MDRDINASKNMLLLLQYEREGIKRPTCFTPDCIKTKGKCINACDTLLRKRR